MGKVLDLQEVGESIFCRRLCGQSGPFGEDASKTLPLGNPVDELDDGTPLPQSRGISSTLCPIIPR